MTCENDFFNNLDTLEIGKEVYIVGSGPNGLQHIDKVNQNACVIALNGACQYPLTFKYWFCFDPDVCNHDWFNTYYTRLINQSVFSTKMLRKTQLKATYSFEKDPNFGKSGTSNDFIFGVLRGGGTIAGAAMQACFYAGCKKINLVGIDMFGTQYFYEEQNNKPQHNEWKQLSTLNHIITILQKRGITVTSLSPTALTI